MPNITITLTEHEAITLSDVIALVLNEEFKGGQRLSEDAVGIITDVMQRVDRQRTE